MVTGVWVGRDDHASLGDGETGGKVAAPIWLDFMKEATKDQPITNFPIPPGVRFVRMESRGNTLPAAESFTDGSVLFEVLVDGSQLPTFVRKRMPRPRPPSTDLPPDDFRRDLDRRDPEAGATSQ